MKRTAAEKQFALWLTTQTNAQGRLYKTHIANHYAACLRSGPRKLDIPLSTEERDIYCCRTLQDFDRLNKIVRTAPNFQDVDRGWTHGAFSAGLSAYRRYVSHLESPDFRETDKCEQLSKLSQIENEPRPFNGEPKRVDFSNPGVCAGCDPVCCVVGGKVFHVRNWRDILTELTEHFLATKPEAQELTWQSIYQRGECPFLLRDKPTGYVAS